MMDEEIWEWMQRDMDGDLSPEEREKLLAMLRNDPDLQLKYDRLKRVSEQLEQLPPVTPPYSLVDAILPQLESGSVRPVAESGPKREPLPKLEVKQAASAAEKPAKWRRAYVWMARIGSGAVAACLLVFLLFMGSGDKQPEADGYQQGSPGEEAPAVAPAVVGPPVPPPSTHSSSVTPGEQPEKPAQTVKPKATEKKDQKPKAEPKSQPAKPAAQPKKTVEPKPPVRPVIEPPEEKPVFPIGLEEKQDDKEKKSDRKEKKEHDGGDDRDDRNSWDDDDHSGSDRGKSRDRD
ncbi:hypothetical protein A6764_15815 [Brevibacillus sp. WF146]|uniref:anti-sigma factor family protein n=1 Tax=Brevibacillus sp. WF146 TaxID=319501 RepID=UPI0007EC5426|nr:hypothetical protein [Brevibacillus sp. WF146]UYZ12279.1 hypothetical protein A6764_15815 [Brevibacillus sp. WF146]